MSISSDFLLTVLASFDFILSDGLILSVYFDLQVCYDDDDDDDDDDDGGDDGDDGDGDVICGSWFNAVWRS